MNKQIQMDKMLKKIEKIADKLNSNLSFDTVYFELTKGLISNKERNYKVNQIFSNFVSHFQNKKNIKVFVDPSWKYFCQFKNTKSNNNYELSNPIKMYLSVNSKNLYDISCIIFEFLERNNIYHESKIGSEIRSDGIVIRVFSKKDEQIIRNFINNNNFIKRNLNDQIPFCFQNDKIGYAIDGDLSFNITVSKYIRDYINNSRLNNSKVSLEGFYKYVLNIYNNVFINRTSIKEFISNFVDKDEKRYFDIPSLLNNYCEVTILLLKSIKSNKFDDYLEMIDFCNDKNLVEKRKDSFKNNSILDGDIELFNNYIITMYKKYGEEKTILDVSKYLLTDDLLCITRDNNLRDNFRNKMNNKKCLKILNGLSVKNYLNRLLDKTNNININNDTDLVEARIYLNKAILETYKKYGLKKTYYAMQKLYFNNDYSSFTNENNARDILIKNVDLKKYKYIIDIYGNKDISIYLNNFISSMKEVLTEQTGIKK